MFPIEFHVKVHFLGRTSVFRSYENDDWSAGFQGAIWKSLRIAARAALSLQTYPQTASRLMRRPMMRRTKTKRLGRWSLLSLVILLIAEGAIFQRSAIGKHDLIQPADGTAGLGLKYVGGDCVSGLD